MSEPVVLVSHFRVTEGKLDAYKQLQAEVARQLEEEKPRTLVFLIYLSENGRQMTAVHVFGDAWSMDLHFEGSDERSKLAYEFLQPEGWEIYGPASDAAVETMRKAATAAGVPFIVDPVYSAGFLRPAPA